MKKLLMMGTVLLCGLSTQLQGAGFAILEQTSAGLGRSLAGMGSDTHEAGALFFNPAAGAWHDKDMLSIGNSLMHVKAVMDLKDRNTAPGNNGGDAGGWVSVPHLFYIHPFGDGFAFGLGMSATSGTATTWGDHWAGRYNNLKTEISVIDITPSISYKVLDNLSIGLGIGIEYADAYMTRAIYTGGKDGKMRLEGDSITLGFTLGALYEPVKGTRIGLGYRSDMTHELELRGKMTAGGRSVKGNADCDLDLPGMLDFSITQDIDDRWKVMADISWTHGEYMDDMTVKFKNDSLGKVIAASTGSYSQSIDMSWGNALRYCVGTEYKWSDDLTLRCGAAYDKTPVKDKHHRVASLPDLNRLWLSCGFSYRLSDFCTLDVGYVHIFFINDEMEAKVNNSQTVAAHVGGCTDILSTALTFEF